MSSNWGVLNYLKISRVVTESFGALRSSSKISENLRLDPIEPRTNVGGHLNAGCSTDEFEEDSQLY